MKDCTAPKSSQISFHAQCMDKRPVLIVGVDTRVTARSTIDNGGDKSGRRPAMPMEQAQIVRAKRHTMAALRLEQTYGEPSLGFAAAMR